MTCQFNPDPGPDCVCTDMCGMPTDDGGSWCERTYQIGAARDQIRHHLDKLNALGEISFGQVCDVVEIIEGTR